MRLRITKQSLLTMLIVGSMGLTGCQSMSFPNRPFAGKFNLPRILPAGLPVPQFSGLAKLPRPNFGNIINSATRPASNSVASGGTSAPGFAGDSKQPPPPPMRNFDTSAADRQIAASEANEATDAAGSNSVASLASRGEAAATNGSSARGFDFSAARKDAIAGKPPVSTESGLTAAQKKFQSALAGVPASELWKDYRPETSAGTAAAPGSVNSMINLGNVNPKLYDQYGKLVSSANAQDATQKLVNPGRIEGTGFDGNRFEKVVSNAKESEAAASTIEQLRNEIAQLRSRGSGSSETFTLPNRSAIEIAGLQPLLPDPVDTVKEELESPMHRGFGDADRFASLDQPVVIPDPTAPRNLLRAAPPKTPGLVASTSIETPRSSSANRGGEFSSVDRSSLPQGNRLGDFALAAADDGSGTANQMVNNAFTQKDASPQSLTTISATAKKVVRDQELPLEISDAATLAIAARENSVPPLPVIDQKARSPFTPNVRSEVAYAAGSSDRKGRVADPKFISAFGDKPLSPFSQTVAVPRQRVTANRFFEPAVAAPTSVAVVSQNADDEGGSLPTSIVESAPSARVASVPDFGTPIEAQSVLEVEDEGYSPGSVKSTRKQLW